MNARPQSSRLLKSALLGNAIFSLGSAIVFLLGPGRVSAFLGLDAAGLIRGIGLGLLVFSFDLFHQATRARVATWRALYASLGDFLWVIGSLVLILGFSVWFSGKGVMLVAIVAVIVAFFGILQIVGILRAHRAGDGRQFRHCVSVGVTASADEMWAVISKLGEIARYMPELRRSTIRGDLPAGENAVRECEDRSGRRWAEQCTFFAPKERRFEVRFLADEPGFPYPAHHMSGGWQVLPVSERTCEVQVWWEIDPKPRWLAALLLPVLGFQVDRSFPKLIARMAAAATGKASPSFVRSSSLSARLLAQHC